MKKYRFLTALFAGTIAYVCASIFCGRDGIWVQNQLTAQKRLLSTHTAAIEKVNEDLTLEKTALQKDMDVIASFAHKLGYVGPGEKLVKISGLPNLESPIYDPGMLLRHEEPKFVPEWGCKVTGFIFFIIVYILLLLFDVSRGNIAFKKRKSYASLV